MPHGSQRSAISPELEGKLKIARARAEACTAATAEAKAATADAKAELLLLEQAAIEACTSSSSEVCSVKPATNAGGERRITGNPTQDEQLAENVFAQLAELQARIDALRLANR